jgi:hypothetical protein
MERGQEEAACERCGHGERMHGPSKRAHFRDLPNGRVQVRYPCEVRGCDCFHFLVEDNLDLWEVEVEVRLSEKYTEEPEDEQ